VKKNNKGYQSFLPMPVLVEGMVTPDRYCYMLTCNEKGTNNQPIPAQQEQCRRLPDSMGKWNLNVKAKRQERNHRVSPGEHVKCCEVAILNHDLKVQLLLIECVPGKKHRPIVSEEMG
jgi:hypothetical protein